MESLVSRSAFEDRPVRAWPQLMSAKTAASYLDMGEDRFRRLMSRWGITPALTGAGDVRWSRSQLDHAIEKLTGDPHRPADDAAAAAGLEKVRRRMGG